MDASERKPLLSTVPDDQPCDGCGTLLVWGTGLTEYLPADDEEEPELVDGYEVAEMPWCPNSECQSNHVRRGLLQIGPDLWRCKVCGAELVGVIVEAHRRGRGEVKSENDEVEIVTGRFSGPTSSTAFFKIRKPGESTDPEDGSPESTST